MNRQQRRALEHRQRGKPVNQAANLHRQVKLVSANRSPTDEQCVNVIVVPFITARIKFDHGEADLADLRLLFEMVAITWHIGHILFKGTSDRRVRDQLIAMNGRIAASRDALLGIVKRWDRLGKLGFSGDERTHIAATEADLGDIVPLVSKGILLQATMAAADTVEKALRGDPDA